MALNKQQKRNKPVRKKKQINVQRLVLIISFIFYMLFQVLAAFRDAKPTVGSITLQELYDLADNGEIKSVNVTKTSNTLIVTKTDGTMVDAVNPKNDTFIYDLMNRGIYVEVQSMSLMDSIIEIVLLIPITLIMMMFITYLSNTIIGGSTKMFTLLKHELNNTTFDDIKGLGKTRDEIMFLVNQMRNWKKLGELGARPCRGALLYGPPGTGKTMLARAIAKEAGVSFISASGSDFNEMFVGVGAARIRSLWELASTNAPCVIFIDEIDCLGKRRKGNDGSSTENNQTLNALLQRMDGINESRGILVIGATNRKDDLDSALLRPGRFDRHYYIGAPDNKKDRDELVEIYLKNKKLDEGVTLEKASKLMIGLSGAEIEQALNEAVYISLQENREGIIKLSDIDEAVMQIHTGGVKKEHSSERDEKVVAIHEAGHTLVSLLLDIDIDKVSIIPYSSGTGGITKRDIDKTGDIKLKFKDDFINDIKILLAGKIAEELIYGSHTQGCSNDIERATSIVYNMVTAHAYDDNHIMNENTLICNGVAKYVSPEVIDKCNELLSVYNEATYKLLEDNTDKLLKLRDMLLDNKTLVSPTLGMLE